MGAELAGVNESMAKINREQIEYSRLAELYRDIPENSRELLDGLLWQAARLRVNLDDLWKDIQKNGDTEIIVVKDDSRTVKRPQADLFTARDKNYQAIMKQLNELLPPKKDPTGFSKLMDDDD